MTDTMGTATLILEFLKVLIWPAVILAIVLIFRSHLERILRQLSDRLGTAETLKLGPAGVQVSWSAKELAKDFLAQSSDPQVSEGKRQAIDDDAARALSDPITDVVGLALWRQKGPARVGEIVQAVVDLVWSTDNVSLLFISGLRRRVEKALTALQALDYVEAKDNEYDFTAAGRRFFQRVTEHEPEVLNRYRYDI
jgi:hypothetical protein